MTDEGWVYIPGWHKFQHYKNRRPPWIKTYTDLLHRDAYLGLTLADRGLLQGLWLLTSVSPEGHVRYNRTAIGKQLNVRRVSLEGLIQAGFVEIRASAPDYNRASTETETEKPLKAFSVSKVDRGSAPNPVEAGSAQWIASMSRYRDRLEARNAQ